LELKEIKDNAIIKQKHFHLPKARPTLSASFTAPVFLPPTLRYSLLKDLFSTTLPHSREGLPNGTTHGEMGLSTVTFLCNKFNKCVDFFPHF